MTRVWTLGCLIFGLGLLGTGCSDDGDDMASAMAGMDAGDGDGDGDGSEMLEIIGRYENEFGGEEVISEGSWDFDYREAEIVAYNNADNWVVTKRADSEEDSPGTYDRLVYTGPVDGVLYYCTTDFYLESEAEAVASTTEADADDLEAGCFDFAWSALTPLAP